MENQFDDLAKSLAEGVTRRDALRRIGGALVGVVLASLSLPAKAAPANACCKDLCHESGAKGNSCAKSCSGNVASGMFCCIKDFTSDVWCFGDLDKARANCSNLICP